MQILKVCKTQKNNGHRKPFLLWLSSVQKMQVYMYIFVCTRVSTVESMGWRHVFFTLSTPRSLRQSLSLNLELTSLVCKPEAWPASAFRDWVYRCAFLHPASRVGSSELTSSPHASVVNTLPSDISLRTLGGKWNSEQDA